jgi:hypothetical protein
MWKCCEKDSPSIDSSLASGQSSFQAASPASGGKQSMKRIRSFRAIKAQRISIVAIAALLTLFLTSSTPRIMASNTCGAQEHQPVQSENGSTVSGHAVLLVDNSGAHALMHAENLTPGVAYTVWYVYFDDTSRCLTPHHCGPPDLIMPASNPEGVFGRMDNAVAGDEGELTFHATLRDFTISPGSAVHLALFAHGPASTTDNQERARQLLTPQTPVLGTPGLGVGARKGFLVGAAMFDIPACK